MSKIKPKVLVVDDNQDILLTARILLNKNGFDTSLISDPENIKPMLETGTFDVVLLDMNYSSGATDGKEGLYWLDEISKLKIPSSVVLITAYGEVDLAVEAMKRGAVDFVVKPWENKRFLATVHTACKLSQSKREIGQLKSRQDALIHEIGSGDKQMIGESKVMQDVFATIQKVANTDANVLILGENGTGKELVANAIHKESDRSNDPFINVDMGALTETLFESELFGHKKGAFTDAHEDKAGRFEVASGGTLFLDEIGNLSSAMQSKLLSVLQKRQINRVGSNNPIDIDIRLVSATNMPLKSMVDEGSFRQDLLYRINTIEIVIPPLRDRQEDIPLILDHFVGIYGQKYKKDNIKVGSDVIKKLKKYMWPGNVRELQHVIERAIIMADKAILSAEDFMLETIGSSKSSKNQLNLENLEKDTIYNALKKHQFNVSAAAKELGLGRTTMYRKMSKYGF